jgi:hypothetical protein
MLLQLHKPKAAREQSRAVNFNEMKATLAFLADNHIHNLVRKLSWDIHQKYRTGVDFCRLPWTQHERRHDSGLQRRTGDGIEPDSRR